MKIFIRTVILFVSFLLAMSCRNEADHVFLTVEDVADEKLAFQKGDLSKSQIASLFPEAETRYFSSTSEMLMSLSIHKFDACVVSSALADKILAELKDYALLEQPDSDCDSIKVVVHKSRIPGRNIENASHENIVNDFLFRCYNAGKIQYVNKDIVPYIQDVPVESARLLTAMLESENLENVTAHPNTCDELFALILSATIATELSDCWRKHRN